MIEKIVKAIEGKPLMELRKPLLTLFKDKQITFNNRPYPSFMIAHEGRNIVLINKKYVTGPDAVVGDVAIGYIGS